MAEDRIQKKMEPKWDPLERAHQCIGLLREDVKRCDVSGIIAHTGCVFGNAEAAFYEKQASEDEMVSLKDMAVDMRKDFSTNCECTHRK